MSKYSELKQRMAGHIARGDTHCVFDRAEILEVIAENDRLTLEFHKTIDALLNHCDDGECATCGQIICPHGDGMHFHHDGCPSCAQDDSHE